MKLKKVHTTLDEFLALVQKALGSGLSQVERKYVEDRHFSEFITEANGRVSRVENVNNPRIYSAAEDVRSWRKATAERASVQIPYADAQTRDYRWHLLHELGQAARQFEHLGLVRISGTNLGTVFGGGGRPPELSRYVDVTFDNRLSLDAVVRELRKLWPHARKAGMLRQSHPLDKRKIDLLRHVCLAVPNSNWTERLSRWNSQYPKQRFSDIKAMITACHDAEESLTGDRRGLAWFYDPLARLSAADLKNQVGRGDIKAQREQQRRLEAFKRSLTSFGIEYVEEPGAPKTEPKTNKGGK